MEPDYGKFVADKQTLYDLGLLDDGKGKSSVFSIFNRARWIGSRLKLECIFEMPLTDIKVLRERVEILKYLGQHPGFLDFGREQLSFIEIYFSHSDSPRNFSRWAAH